MNKILYFLLLLSASAIRAKDGVLDPDFGTNGQIVNNFGGITQVFQDVKIQNDDKIVGAGTLNTGTISGLVARYNIDGTLDTTFNGQGFSTFTIAPTVVNSIVIQPNGKIVLGGTFNNNTNFFLARYNTNGSIDTSFGTNGFVNDIAAPGLIVTLAIDHNGIIYAVGADNTGLAGGKIVAYNPDGSHNASFGSAGIVTPIVPGSTIALLVITIQNDQKIVVTGNITTAGVTSVFTARYLGDGTLDTSFGDGGIQITLIGTSSRGRALAIQYDGKIVIGVFNVIGGNLDFGLIRYTPEGILDPSFGNAGFISTTGFTDGRLFDISLQTDGKIIASGRALLAGQPAFALARYLPNGVLDTAFGINGTGRVQNQILGSINSVSNASALASNGNLILAGNADIGGITEVAVAEYTIDSLQFSQTSHALWQRYYNKNIVQQFALQ